MTEDQARPQRAVEDRAHHVVVVAVQVADRRPGPVRLGHQPPAVEVLEPAGRQQRHRADVPVRDPLLAVRRRELDVRVPELQPDAEPHLAILGPSHVERPARAPEREAVAQLHRGTGGEHGVVHPEGIVERHRRPQIQRLEQEPEVVTARDALGLEARDWKQHVLSAVPAVVEPGSLPVELDVVSERSEKPELGPRDDVHRCGLEIRRRSLPHGQRRGRAGTTWTGLPPRRMPAGEQGAQRTAWLFGAGVACPGTDPVSGVRRGMRALLTSSGITNRSLNDALVGLLGKPIAASRALFVPTAIHPFPGGPDLAYRAITGQLLGAAGAARAGDRSGLWS